MKPSAGRAARQATSSRRPSILGGWAVRVATRCGRGGRGIAVGSVAADSASTSATRAAEVNTGAGHCITAAMALVDRLAELVSFDTQNPEGELGALGARSVDEVEVGDHAYVYARFGTELPRLVLNAHVDTVPANSGYSSPPHLLVRRGDRLHGLGTCDIKGAIAGVLEALATGPVNRSVGVLFSGDEERGGSCIRAFLDSEAARGLERAIVCEPTGCRVGIRHRGIGAATATLEGPGGHSSLVDGLTNPVAVLARAAVALDEMGLEHKGKGPAGFEGIHLNVAALDGGIAFNVVPTRATLSFSLRPAPGAIGAGVDELRSEEHTSEL